MNLLNNWVTCVILYLILAVTYHQVYKVSTKNVKKAGALTILLQAVAIITTIFLIPFFEMKFPTNIKIYLLLGIAIVGYAIYFRLSTTIVSKIELSIYSIIGQLANVFLVIFGILFLGEEFVLKKFMGAMLIIFSNIFLFYEKGKFQFNKYIALAVISNFIGAIALAIDAKISAYFNLPIYNIITLGIPAILIGLVEKIKIADIKEEFKIANKKILIATGVVWGLACVPQLRAYQLGSLNIVVPLCSLTVILDVIVSYLFLKERDNLLKKIIAATVIIVSIMLIKL